MVGHRKGCPHSPILPLPVMRNPRFSSVEVRSGPSGVVVYGDETYGMLAMGRRADPLTVGLG